VSAVAEVASARFKRADHPRISQPLAVPENLDIGGLALLFPATRLFTYSGKAGLSWYGLCIASP